MKLCHLKATKKTYLEDFSQYKVKEAFTFLSHTEDIISCKHTMLCLNTTSMKH